MRGKKCRDSVRDDTLGDEHYLRKAGAVCEDAGRRISDDALKKIK
jgi:hypothetical protein